ncbi:type II CAAX endopeptidase family protein [Staphylococcus sp. NRL 16/872]|uniref:CPBP family intramembrane glutamic endopeptidase n=1 Tax=Staphylococcus sp. NRL 16/872 TaxID=2930131 RepID=UPI001FB53181|nr:type II CAAX endopeptidase family protein [Staphylococcus sp. NRL 16/872]WEN69567.1 type II CAAX endopeptidase family protein [Staphylococcus sp. NRL 16/872]
MKTISQNKPNFQISEKPYWKLLLQSIMLFVLFSIVYIFISANEDHLSALLTGTLLVIGIFLLGKWLNIQFFTFEKFTKEQVMIVILSVVICQAMYYLFTLPISTTSNQQDINSVLARLPFINKLLSTAILSPIIEEVVFRGLLIKGLFRGIPIIGAVLSVILFGAAHIPTNIWEWLIYGGYGFVFVTAYLKTKRLEVPMIIHILHNSLFLIIYHV